MQHLPSRDSAAKWIVAAFLLIVIVGAIGFVRAMESTTRVQIGDTVIAAQVADSNAEKQQGLSGTKQLADDEGMLFVFSKSLKPSIWMKDMNYSIDIIWIDAEKKVVDITSNVSPDTYPDTFEPHTPIRYILEVKAGFAERNNVRLGSPAHFTLAD